MSETEWLDPGEKLIWSGRPDPWAFAWKKGLARALFGILFFGFSIFWVSEAGRTDAIFALFGVPFVLVGLGLVLSPLWYYVQGARTTYTLTSRRAIINTTGSFARHQSFELSQVGPVEVQPSADGSGHLLFHERVYLGPRGAPQREQEGFIGVAGVKQVDRLFRSAMNKAVQQQRTAA